jgi:hypothetical protein
MMAGLGAGLKERFHFMKGKTRTDEQYIFEAQRLQLPAYLNMLRWIKRADQR